MSSGARGGRGRRKKKKGQQQVPDGKERVRKGRKMVNKINKVLGYGAGGAGGAGGGAPGVGYDPEDDDFTLARIDDDEDVVGHGSDSSDVPPDDGDNLAPSKGRLLLRAGVELDDEFEGQATTRAAIADEWDGDLLSNDSDGGVDADAGAAALDEIMANRFDLSSSDDDSRGGRRRMDADGFGSDLDDGDDLLLRPGQGSDDFEHDYSAFTDEEGESGDGGGGGGGGFGAFEAELAGMAEEDTTVMQTFSAQRGDELEKARHTRNQRLIVDKVLGLRVSMQPLVDAVNDKLPPPADVGAWRDHEEVASQLETSTAALLGLTTDLMALQRELALQNPAWMPAAQHLVDIGHGAEETSQTLDQLWASEEAYQRAAREPQNEAITEWQRRTHLSSGMALKNLKAINRDIPSQVEEAMARDGATAHAFPADNHTYDDSRFYQKMLREVLQGGGGGGGLAGAGPGSLMAVDDPDEMSRQWLAMAKLKEARKSKKKKVDTRASKGRKLRYDVHERLVNFVAPRPFLEDPPVELFRSLFGYKKPGLNLDEASYSSYSSSEEEGDDGGDGGERETASGDVASMETG